MYRWFNGKRWIDSDRYDQMREGRAFFMKMLNADCKRIAVENPLPLKICDMPEPTQTIQPYEFGDPYSKRTLLWLKGLEPLKPTKILENHETWIASNTSMFAKGKGGSHGVAKSQRERSRTFQGIADAMADQWG